MIKSPDISKFQLEPVQEVISLKFTPSNSLELIMMPILEILLLSRAASSVTRRVEPSPLSEMTSPNTRRLCRRTMTVLLTTLEGVLLTTWESATKTWKLPRTQLDALVFRRKTVAFCQKAERSHPVLANTKMRRLESKTASMPPPPRSVQMERALPSHLEDLAEISTSPSIRASMQTSTQEDFTENLCAIGI